MDLGQERYRCEEQRVPGWLYDEACPKDHDFASWDALSASCWVWETLFGLEHPEANCLVLKLCNKPEVNCLFLLGHLALTIGNVTAYQANQSATEAAISRSISTALGLPQDSVSILQIRGWRPNTATFERLEDDPQSSSSQSRMLSPKTYRSPSVSSPFYELWEETEPIVDNSNISMVKFYAASLPVTLRWNSLPERAASLAAHMDKELGDGTVTSAQFTPWPPVYAHMDEVSITMQYFQNVVDWLYPPDNDNYED